jgi:hypothetical protein
MDAEGALEAPFSVAVTANGRRRMKAIVTDDLPVIDFVKWRGVVVKMWMAKVAMIMRCRPH